MTYICFMAGDETITISKQEFEQLKLESEQLESENAWLKYQLAELKRMIYGAKSERFVPQDIHQPTLFELPEEERDEKPAEYETVTRKKPGQKKRHPLRMEIPAHLPRRTEVIEPEDLPEGSKKIGETITELLEVEPANIYVRQIIRPKYIVEQDDEQTRIVTADLPTLPIPKGNAGASMLAHIIVNKFTDHLPFYRQVQIFKRQKVDIPESTIGGWFSASSKLLEPLYGTLQKHILSRDYLQADETPIPVLTKDKPGSTHKGYHWVYYDPVGRQVLFSYQPSREREGPDEMLKNFSGYLQTDGYAAYNNLKNQAQIQHMACMAHARRKFEHAKDNEPVLVPQIMAMFHELYEIEREAKEKNLLQDEIKALRLLKATDILKNMKVWLDNKLLAVPPKSAFGSAVAYTLNLWPRLIRYLEDGRFQIDNNLIENSIRPVALGRKNYLFAGSHEAAQNAAMIYSLLASCKINNVEPFSWLKDTLSVIPDWPANQLDKLLPRQK
ncbi:IS66 family transposase [Patescibacteria group bacterium]|nr:IS66 family transposase [Patescibacteria group bacterium]